MVLIKSPINFTITQSLFDGNSHISLRYKQVVKLFGIVDDRPYHYHLPGCRHEREKVARLLSQAGEVELRIAINPLPPPRIKTSVVTRWRPWSSGYMLCLTGSVS